MNYKEQLEKYQQEVKTTIEVWIRETVGPRWDIDKLYVSSVLGGIDFCLFTDEGVDFFTVENLASSFNYTEMYLSPDYEGKLKINFLGIKLPKSLLLPTLPSFPPRAITKAATIAVNVYWDDYCAFESDDYM